MARSRSRSPRERGVRPASHAYNGKAQSRDRRRGYSPAEGQEKDYRAYGRGRAGTYRDASRSHRDGRSLHRRESRSPDTNERSRSASYHRRRSFRPITDKSEKSRMTEVSSSKTLAGHSVAEQDPAVESNDIAAMMGFGGFGSTKGDKVKGNDAGAVAKAPKRVEYRQYMNRPGGFNRPLDN